MPKHVILISIGSNIDRIKYTNASRRALAKCFDDLSVSSVYESEAVGFSGSPFYNWVARATTSLSIGAVCHILKQIEKDNGRVHSDKKFCSRTLDLDLLTYDDKVITDPLVLPREEILYNAFVLQPLAELVPQDKHPVSGESYHALWQAFDKTKQILKPIEFNWS